MDSLKKCGSRVGPANQGRRGGPGRRDVGRVRESESERERGIKVCESEQRGHFSRRAGLPADRWRQVGLLSYFLLFPVFVSLSTHRGDSSCERLSLADVIASEYCVSVWITSSRERQDAEQMCRSVWERLASLLWKTWLSVSVITAEEQSERDWIWFICVLVTDLLRRLLPCGLELRRSVDEI